MKDCKLLGVQDLAAIYWLVGILEGIGQPVVHAQVEIADDKDRRLASDSEISNDLPAEFKGFLQIARQQADLSTIAMTQEMREKQIALAGARGQARAGSHPRDIPESPRESRRK